MTHVLRESRSAGRDSRRAWNATRLVTFEQYIKSEKKINILAQIISLPKQARAMNLTVKVATVKQQVFGLTKQVGPHTYLI